ncbi:MAG TPA: RsmD family RNA methyltransferase, partial [Vicinamibacteria bacterium]|nr:RsmD family RNA methyltransferase [Vicinamibacteria bacterium]
DRSAQAVEAARENARALAGAGGEVQVLRQEAQTALPALAERGLRFDIVYLDPPYENSPQLYQSLIQLAGERLLAEGGVAVAEHFHKRVLPERIGPLARARLLRVGDHCLSFYRRPGDAAAAGEGENGTDEDQAP